VPQTAISAPSAAEVILLVDDDAAVLASLQFALELQGFSVRPYPSAEALLAQPELPSHGCLVLDYNLPGLDGLALLERLRDRGVALPALLITTPTSEAMTKARAAGVEVVEKPLLGDALALAVKRVLAPAPRF